MEKMTFRRAKCEIKSCSYNGNKCPENTNFCQVYPFSLQTPSPDFVGRGHLDGENDMCLPKVVHTIETGAPE